MFGEKSVEFRQLGHNVVVTSPVHAAGVMDVHFFIGKPLDAISKTITTIDAGERRKLVAHQRPLLAAFSKAGVIVRFAVMHERANARTLEQRMVEVAGNVVPVVFLKEFRVSPLHAASCEEIFRVFPAATEAL